MRGGFTFGGSGKATWRKQHLSRDFTNKQGLPRCRKWKMLLRRECPEMGTERPKAWNEKQGHTEKVAGMKGKGSGVTKEFIGNVQRIRSERTSLAFEDNLPELSLDSWWRGGGWGAARRSGGGLHYEVVLGTGK